MTLCLSLALAAKGEIEGRDLLGGYREAGVFDDPRVEIHLATDRVWPGAEPKPHPNLTLHRCPPPCSIFRLWGIAIAASRAPYVAVLDLRCPPEPGWLEGVLQEIDRRTALFFGPVEPHRGQPERAHIGYLLEYAQFKRPLALALDEVPGNNLVCRRDLLPGGNVLRGRGFVKTVVLGQRAREGCCPPVPLNDIAVRYQRPFTLRPYLVRRLAHGRYFASHRHELPNQPPRSLCLAFTPLLPLLRVVRAARWARRDGALWRAFRANLHLLLLAEVAWSFGEALGYAAGPGAYGDLD